MDETRCSHCGRHEQSVAPYRARHDPGEFFGEMALLDGGPRTATVTTRSEVQAYVLGRREFGGLLDGAPTAATNMLRTMSRRLRAA